MCVCHIVGSCNRIDRHLARRALEVTLVEVLARECPLADLAGIVPYRFPCWRCGGSGTWTRVDSILLSYHQSQQHGHAPQAGFPIPVILVPFSPEDFCTELGPAMHVSGEDSVPGTLNRVVLVSRDACLSR
jgi:hypothetical protein